MTKKLSVLYMDGVGPFGGASRSLFEAVGALPQGTVNAYFLATKGTSVDFYETIASDLIQTRGLSRFDNTRYSHYAGRRWLILLREAYLAPHSYFAVRAAKKRWGGKIDLIHTNEVLEIFPAIYAKRMLNVPLVVHVRSVQNLDPKSKRYRLICNLLRKHADAVIAIDENVRASLPADIAVDVIHNSFTPKVANTPDVELIRAIEALPNETLKVGFVGNLHHSKGLFEMVEAARLLKDQGRYVDFVIVGGTTISDTGPSAAALSKSGLAQNIRSELFKRAKELGVADRFHMLGATTDIQCVYTRIDVICFASHYDAPGRPIFEAAFAGVPSIVAITDPSPDTLVPNTTGIAIPPRDAEALAKAISRFDADRFEIRRMGDAARQLAVNNFSPATNSEQLLEVYKRVKRIAA
ncbi:glycosyltransferase family 4 protein [Devosia sp. LjRoot3]|uniref:glycosyltransferase family 4 protein n=1 Tax=Devosia sp. LjRoot3 TaxID=3342319 RepID=UPI003ECCB3DD